MSIKIRKIELKDTYNFYDMKCKLDHETRFMMFEPNERKSKNSALKELNESLEFGDLILIAENEAKEIVGYLVAERGRYNRIYHTAYIIVGILKYYQNCGIGTKFFEELNIWSSDREIFRLELTVEVDNEKAIQLYEKMGFKIEGRREKSMKVDGSFVDEYYMAKLL